jgi:anti-sigma factor RsiW
MCDGRRKLIAWLDGELPQEEGAEIARHVEGCAECRSECEAYERVSKTFDAYCDAVVAAKTHRRVPRWLPALSGAAVAVAVTMLFLSLPRARVEPRPVPAPVAAAVPVTVLAPPPAPGRKIRRPRPPVARVHEQVARWRPAESAVQIAIPAEAMFPPGAMPEGMSFIAEVSIGADGSVDRLRLRP